LRAAGEILARTVPKGAVDWHIEDHAGKGLEKLREVCDIIKEKVKD